MADKSGEEAAKPTLAVTMATALGEPLLESVNYPTSKFTG